MFHVKLMTVTKLKEQRGYCTRWTNIQPLKYMDNIGFLQYEVKVNFTSGWNIWARLLGTIFLVSTTEVCMCAVFLKLWPLIGSQVCSWWVLTRQTRQFVLISSSLRAGLNLDNLCLSWKGWVNLAIKVCRVRVPVRLCGLPVLRWPRPATVRSTGSVKTDGCGVPDPMTRRVWR